MTQPKLTLISHHLCPFVQRAAIDHARSVLEETFSRVEEALGDGPWFSGEDFSLVDAAFAPVFRYFDLIDELTGIDFFTGTPKVATWRKALQQRPSVIGAVSDDYPERLLTFFADRNSVIGQLAQATVIKAAA
jgi:glutathione S-transferase